MRMVALLVAIGCGSQPDHPFLANAPHPDNGAVAGVAAAAAAAVTLADPNAAARKPEKKDDQEKRPIEVKEHVTSDVLDRLDKPIAVEPAAATATDKPAVPAKQSRKGPPP